MPAEFPVPVDPDELAAQSVAAAMPPGAAKGEARRPGRSEAPPAGFQRKAGGRGARAAAQPRRYAFRRS